MLLTLLLIGIFDLRLLLFEHLLGCCLKSIFGEGCCFSMGLFGVVDVVVCLFDRLLYCWVRILVFW